MNRFLQSILCISIIGLNPIVFAMDPSSLLRSEVRPQEVFSYAGQDTPFQCKVPVSGFAPKIEAQQPAQQETKKTQAELDAAQFAKERESKRRNALPKAGEKMNAGNKQFCKTVALMRKLPAPLQRYVCSYLDKQFYLDRSFKAHNNAFKQVIPYTKADGSWYIIALTIDNIVAKIDGTTGEVLSVIDKIPSVYNICVVPQPDDKWLIFIKTNNRTYDNEGIHIYDEEFEAVEENDDLIRKYFELKDGDLYLGDHRNGNTFYDAYKRFSYQKDPSATIIIAKYQVPEIGDSYEKWRNRTELMRKKISIPSDVPALVYSAYTLHIKPNGAVNLICTNMNGQMSIISEGPEIFEQCLTNNFIPSLELPVPVEVNQPVDDDHDQNLRRNNNRSKKPNLNTLSQLKQSVIGGILAAGAVGAGIALMKYLKR